MWGIQKSRLLSLQSGPCCKGFAQGRHGDSGQGAIVPGGVIVNGLQGWAVMPRQYVELRDETRAFQAERTTQKATYGRAEKTLGSPDSDPLGFESWLCRLLSV